jgi:Ca2+/Na+ antiporter
VRPLPVDWRQILVPLLVMIVAHLGLLLLIWRGKIGRWAGAILVAAYIGYLVATVVVRLPLP